LDKISFCSLFLPPKVQRLSVRSVYPYQSARLGNTFKRYWFFPPSEKVCWTTIYM